MRILRQSIPAILVLFLAALGATPAHAGVSFDFFYSNLGPHGSWMVSGQYGRVWQPAGYHPGWSPYVDGHWVYADVGWTWVSDYDWGAIPYHYGTWVLDPVYGWVWVPGYTWAPSWVVFRTGPDFIGWAPVAPGFSVGVSFGVPLPAAGSFVFVSAGNFLAPHLHGCVLPAARTAVFFNRTTVVNNFRVENNIIVNRGPDPGFIGRATGRQVRAVPIERVSRVAPGPRFNRADFRVDRGGSRRELRAAEPVPRSTPLPDAGRRSSESRLRQAPNRTSGSFAPRPAREAGRGTSPRFTRPPAERAPSRLAAPQRMSRIPAERAPSRYSAPPRMTRPPAAAPGRPSRPAPSSQAREQGRRAENHSRNTKHEGHGPGR